MYGLPAKVQASACKMWREAGATDLHPPAIRIVPRKLTQNAAEQNLLSRGTLVQSFFFVFVFSALWKCCPQSGCQAVEV